MRQSPPRLSHYIPVFFFVRAIGDDFAPLPAQELVGGVDVMKELQASNGQAPASGDRSVSSNLCANISNLKATLTLTLNLTQTPTATLTLTNPKAGELLTCMGDIPSRSVARLVKTNPPPPPNLFRFCSRGPFSLGFISRVYSSLMKFLFVGA